MLEKTTLIRRKSAYRFCFAYSIEGFVNRLLVRSLLADFELRTSDEKNLEVNGDEDDKRQNVV